MARPVVAVQRLLGTAGGSRLRTSHRLLGVMRSQATDSVMELINLRGRSLRRSASLGASGPASGRPDDPNSAGGAVRNLDYRNVRVTEQGVDVVEAHVRRFDGGGDAELAMTERLRSIAGGEMLPEPVDLRFYTHELRESVRYRRLGFPTGTVSADGAIRSLEQRPHRHARRLRPQRGPRCSVSRRPKWKILSFHQTFRLTLLRLLSTRPAGASWHQVAMALSRMDVPRQFDLLETLRELEKDGLVTREVSEGSATDCWKVTENAVGKLSQVSQGGLDPRGF